MKAFREMVLRAWDLCVNDIVFISNTSSIFRWTPLKKCRRSYKTYKRDESGASNCSHLKQNCWRNSNETLLIKRHLPHGSDEGRHRYKTEGRVLIAHQSFYLFIYSRIHWRLNFVIKKITALKCTLDYWVWIRSIAEFVAQRSASTSEKFLRRP